MIKDVTDLVVLIGKLGTAVGKAKEDGKWTWTDMQHFIAPMGALPSALAGISNVDDEFMNMTPEEKESLKQTFKAELDLPDDGLEEKFEAAFNAALEFAKAVTAFV